MTQAEAPFGPRNVGEEAKPPYVVLPDPSALFTTRAKRLQVIASGHMLEPYLRFVAIINEAQQRIANNLPSPQLPNQDRLSQALEYGLPPLSVTSFELDEAAVSTLNAFLIELRDADLPEEAAAAVGHLTNASAEVQRGLMRAALAGEPPEDVAQRVFVLAALQPYFTKLAAQLDVASLHPLADGVCPACGSAPLSSSVVGWPKAHNSRFCTCSLCGTMWNVVRVKCVLCSSTGGISYHSIEGKPETVKAETCETCRRYVKILYQVKDHLLEPLADDIASLDLDMVLAKEGWSRGGANPFLLGY